ncbi:MAG: transcription-repair coupling factor [Chlamydiia bacterium]
MKPFAVDGLTSSTKAHFIEAIQKKDPLPYLIISEGNPDLFHDLTYFFQKEPLELVAKEANLDVEGLRYKVVKAFKDAVDSLPLIVSIQTLFDPLPNPESLAFFSLKEGQLLPFDPFLFQLETFGLNRKKIVVDKGDYAIRGGLVDLFPIDALEPIRVEFDGDKIASLRHFDPVSQRSTKVIQEFQFLPTSTEGSITLLDLFPTPFRVFLDHPTHLEDRMVQLKVELAPFLEKAKEVYFLFDEMVESLIEDTEIAPVGRDFYQGKQTPLIDLELFKKTYRLQHDFLFYEPIEAHLDLNKVGHLLHQPPFDKMAVHLLAQTPVEEKFFEELLPDRSKNCVIQKGYLSQGFIYRQKELFLPHTEFSKRKKIHRKRWRVHNHVPVSEFHELEPGDLVVHYHNGVGKFLGFEQMSNHQKVQDDFIVLEYANSSKLYVPMSQSHLVSRYIGAKEDHRVTLNALGTNTWAKTKLKVEKAIVGYARELLHRQAMRQIKGGFQYPSDSLEMELFEDAFAFDETIDQIKAIQDIKQDMCSTEGMDRLILGDVGYGKTEIAMRAAAKAVLDGQKQVAVLVPTTVLAVQHFENFKLRMEGFPIRIELVCRFRSTKEIKNTLQEVNEGKIDILIGTHRIISKDVLFKDLGLIIVDEEQRFGVRAKEWLKQATIGVDCLTLSATPIPRTLHLSLVNARKMSVISSPPSDRLPVKVAVVEESDSVIQDGLINEFQRGGQAYFLYNRVETIHEMKDKLQKLVPKARIGVVHGQMDPDDIDEIFHGFKKGALDLLLATTIIENGIDIPNANTIFIHRADTFGISDLYQLKGRVGRSDKSAYAYFLIPKGATMKETSTQRIKAIVDASGYGGGLKVAMRDLEIRGAGDILGVQQSGHVASIGFHLYCKLLKRTIDLMRANKQTNFTETKVEIPFEAKLPPFYVDDKGLRMEIYHRFGECVETQEVHELYKEILDRFGPAPIEVKWLFVVALIRTECAKYGVQLVKLKNCTLVMETEKKSLSFLSPVFKTPKEFHEFVLQKLSLFS